MISMTIHAGHAPSGGLGCGAVGLLDESKEAREVVEHLCNRIDKELSGKVVAHDITYTEHASQKQVLNTLVDRINKWNCNVNLSIHLNAGGGCRAESWCYSPNSDSNEIARKISKAISKKIGIGWKDNQYNTKLAVLRDTRVPVCIIECTFVDNQEAYEKWNAKRCADAIFEAIAEYFGENITNIPIEDVDSHDRDFLYKVQMGAFKNKSNAEALKIELERSGYSTYIKKEEV